MRCQINVEMDNAAFDDHSELSRILRRLATELEPALEAEPESLAIPIFDFNGNNVGRCVVKGKR